MTTLSLYATLSYYEHEHYDISELAVVSSELQHCKFLSVGTPLPGKALPLNVHARCLAPDINTLDVIPHLCMCLPQILSFYTVTENNNNNEKKCPEQLCPLHLHIRGKLL